MKEKWLNGWYRQGTTVLMGAGVFCAGCGECQGITCVAIDPDQEPPKKHPEWPFDKEDCPICKMKFDERGPQDKLTERLVALKNKKNI